MNHFQLAKSFHHELAAWRIIKLKNLITKCDLILKHDAFTTTILFFS